MTDLSLSLPLQAWLFDSGSFMQQLRQRQMQPQVKVLAQGWQLAQEAEREALALLPRQAVFVRDVEIVHQDLSLLFARTTIPLATLRGPERRLMHLGRRALGSVLFSHPQWERGDIDILPAHYAQYSTSPLWERRSLFYKNDKALLLTEVFLPALVDIINA